MKIPNYEHPVKLLALDYYNNHLLHTNNDTIDNALISVERDLKNEKRSFYLDKSKITLLECVIEELKSMKC